MAIDDFEWQGELEVSEARGPARPPPPAPWLTRWMKSVWLAPALRLGGMALLLGVLAGIGVVATTYAKPGRPLPDGPRALVDALGTGWLKPTPAPPDVRSPAPAAAASSPSAPPPSLAGGSPSGSLDARLGLGPQPTTNQPSQPTTEQPPQPTTEQPPQPTTATGVTADGKVILNLASAEELTRLPGVGAKRAEAIVALRGKLKRFRQLSDLLRVKGIGPRGLKRMLPHLVLDAPS